VSPGVTRPGAEVQVIARVRRTEFEQSSDGTVRLPLVRAVVVRSEALATATEPVRLWPTAVPGTFDGRFMPGGSGAYSIHVTAGRAEAADVVIRAGAPSARFVRAGVEAGAPSARFVGAGVEAGHAAPRQGDDEEARFIASATGGAVGTPDDLAPIVHHLRSLARSRVAETIHPMRSGWWTAPFALALCAEWALRRRRGDR
jgi:hypothetical protein